MKRSIKGLFVILAIVMSFVLVQGVWARENIVLTTFEGVVTSDTSADDRTIGIDEDGNGVTDVTIYHMGPSWYWDLMRIEYPEVGYYLEIEAFYCDILGEYVGVSVCLNSSGGDSCNESIELRDPDTLKPLWNPKAKTTDLSDTAVEATGDGEPNEPKDNNWDYNNSHYYKERGPHGGNDS